jgi:hypothetical protein
MNRSLSLIAHTLSQQIYLAFIQIDAELVELLTILWKHRRNCQLIFKAYVWLAVPTRTCSYLTLRQWSVLSEQAPLDSNSRCTVSLSRMLLLPTWLEVRLQAGRWKMTLMRQDRTTEIGESHAALGQILRQAPHLDARSVQDAPPRMQKKLVWITFTTTNRNRWIVPHGLQDDETNKRSCMHISKLLTSACGNIQLFSEHVWVNHSNNCVGRNIAARLEVCTYFSAQWALTFPRIALETLNGGVN